MRCVQKRHGSLSVAAGCNLANKLFVVCDAGQAVADNDKTENKHEPTQQDPNQKQEKILTDRILTDPLSDDPFQLNLE